MCKQHFCDRWLCWRMLFGVAGLLGELVDIAFYIVNRPLYNHPKRSLHYCKCVYVWVYSIIILKIIFTCYLVPLDMFFQNSMFSLNRGGNPRSLMLYLSICFLVLLMCLIVVILKVLTRAFLRSFDRFLIRFRFCICFSLLLHG
jgi:hypothetical protein